jgi:heme-degrading monooxygenase HmoA
MVVRATEAEIDVVRMNPRDAIVRFEEMLLPALHEQEGYEGCYVLLSEEGKVLVLSFWESDEAARATRLSGFYQAQIDKLSDLVVYRQTPGREAYDVVVAEAPVPAR